MRTVNLVSLQPDSPLIPLPKDTSNAMSCSIFTAQTGPQQYKQRKYNEHKDLGATRTSHKANKGVVHWPFEFAIAPDANESVEGLRDETWMRWQLSAVVERAGWNTKNIVATCDIRVVRTLGPDQLESTRSRVHSFACQVP